MSREDVQNVAVATVALSDGNRDEIMQCVAAAIPPVFAQEVPENRRKLFLRLHPDDCQNYFAAVATGVGVLSNETRTATTYVANRGQEKGLLSISYVGVGGDEPCPCPPNGADLD